MTDSDLQYAINAAYDQLLNRVKSQWRFIHWLRSSSIEHDDSAWDHLVALRDEQLRRALDR